MKPARSTKSAASAGRKPVLKSVTAAPGPDAAPPAPDPAAPAPEPGAAELRKKELIETVLERSGVKKKFAKPVIEAMIDVLGEAIGAGREVNLQPMGKIKPQRIHDGANARVVMAKIRQNRSGAATPEGDDGTVAEDAKEAVAERPE